jgi:hypothetical protein
MRRSHSVTGQTCDSTRTENIPKGIIEAKGMPERERISEDDFQNDFKPNHKGVGLQAEVTSQNIVQVIVNG